MLCFFLPTAVWHSEYRQREMRTRRRMSFAARSPPPTHTHTLRPLATYTTCWPTSNARSTQVRVLDSCAACRALAVDWQQQRRRRQAALDALLSHCALCGHRARPDRVCVRHPPMLSEPQAARWSHLYYRHRVKPSVLFSGTRACQRPSESHSAQHGCIKPQRRCRRRENVESG